MPGPPAESITLSTRQEEFLRTRIRPRACTQGLAQRIQIVLLAAAGRANERIARELGTTPERVRRWRTRWKELSERLDDAERCDASDDELAELMERGLSDRPRPGTPPSFSAEQVAQIIAVACEKPEVSGRTISHWSPRELADEVTKRGIVQSISARHVGRLLKRGRSETAPNSLLDQQHAEGRDVSRGGRGHLRDLPPSSRAREARSPRHLHG
jgi:putative transposase